MSKINYQLPIALLVIASASVAHADTRSLGMGGVGVSSANYLASSFHNPALAANAEGNDDFGIILPSINLSATDSGKTFDKVDTIQSSFENYKNNVMSPVAKNSFNDSLLAVENEQVTAGVGLEAVVSVPNRFVNTSIFVQSNTSIIFDTNIDHKDLNLTDSGSMELNSVARGTAGGYVDVGVTLAKSFKLYDRDLSVGISPKYQHLFAGVYQVDISTFDEGDYDPDYKSKAAFNLDLGVGYQVHESIGVGVSVKNVFKNELKTNEDHGYSGVYQVNPEFTAGVSYHKGWGTLALDVELNPRKHFKEQVTETQFVRAGAEIDAFGWAQLRGGYVYSMNEHSEDYVTAGIGFKPYGVLGFDLAAEYGKGDHYGASAQLIFTI